MHNGKTLAIAIEAEAMSSAQLPVIPNEKGRSVSAPASS